MTKTDIAQALRGLLKRMLPAVELEDEFRPIEDGGLKSIDGVQIASDMELDLGVKIDDKVNPLVKGEGPRKRGRTLREIVEVFSRAPGVKHA